MQDKESLLPHDWFQKGNADIKTVEILLAHHGDMEIAAMHTQQAIEKYFKGYLLSRGWKLKRTHDLVELLDYVIEYDSKFEKYRSFCEETTAFYFEARYPFFQEGLTKEEVGGLLKQAKEIIKTILEV